MKFAPDQAAFDHADRAEAPVAAGNAGDGCGAAVCVASVEVAGFSEERLRSRIGLIGRAESRLAAMKAQAVAELARLHNAVAAERIVREEL